MIYTVTYKDGNEQEFKEKCLMDLMDYMHSNGDIDDVVSLKCEEETVEEGSRDHSPEITPLPPFIEGNEYKTEWIVDKVNELVSLVNCPPKEPKARTEMSEIQKEEQR